MFPSKPAMPSSSLIIRQRMSEFEIERMGERGDGLVGTRAFARTLPGEFVNVDDRGAYHLTRLSPERVAAFCPAFETCGGCKLQHWQAEPYQKWKTALLTAALKAWGLETQINPLIDAHGQGRRRASFHVREINGEWCAGFMAAGTHMLVPLKACPVLVPAMQNAPVLAARFGNLFGSCDVLVTCAENGLDIAIKASRRLADRAVQSLDAMMRENAITRIALNNEILVQLVPPRIAIGPATVALPIGAFLQATKAGEDTIADLIQGHMGKTKKVADLFCGLGPFAFQLAEKQMVDCFDSDKAAVVALQQAVRHIQGLRPIKAETLDLFRNPLTPTELDAYDAVVLDPPRAGAEAQCLSLAKSKIKRVIMVACDVQTFARDASILCGGGFILREVTPVDQFKYSAHLECVGLLTRR
jgi:23S rRNA (uracil1939-C5)-methyltransferase